MYLPPKVSLSQTLFQTYELILDDQNFSCEVKMFSRILSFCNKIKCLFIFVRIFASKQFLVKFSFINEEKEFCKLQCINCFIILEAALVKNQHVRD